MTLYFDNAATSFPKAPGVAEAVYEYLKEVGASPGRGAYQAAHTAGRLISDARKLIAQLIGAAQPDQIVLTSNATMAINLALKGLLKAGDHVITSSMEHNSVIRPLRHLEAKGVELTIIPCDGQGMLAPDDIIKAIKKNTALVALTHVSNVTGTIMPVPEVAHQCAALGVPLLVDASQSAGILPLDVAEWPVSMLAASGHKGLLGPQGTGFLYVNQGITVRPLVEGGTGTFSELEIQPREMPDGLESGTPNMPGICGLKEGVSFVLDTGVEAIENRERELGRLIRQGLVEMPGISVYGPANELHRTGLVSFNLKDVNPAEVGYVLDSVYGVAVRTGLQCAPLAHRTIGTFPAGTVRVSPGWFNTQADVVALLNAIGDIATLRSRI
ncbi:MAG: aminotransferase class V-fold PLP-dependent enzyme [Deltaproteobacteria bacterium]|nr:aminotransferase class V-fold PLP-dependent enzyme [Deltaproteobacteria bacterium]